MRHAVLAFLAMGLLAPAPAAAGDAVRYSWEKEIYVPMRDGVRLSTDVLLPAEGDGPFPTVLVRTPYHKDNVHWILGGAANERFLANGYAVVIQNERGRHFSEGDYDRYLAGAATDGLDTLSWIAVQPWSNGRVGTYGCSSSGEQQWPMAAGNHPNHTAMLPLASGTAVGEVPGNHSRGAIYRGGVRMNGLWVWWYGDMATGDRLLLPPDTTQEDRIRLRGLFNTQAQPYFFNTLPGTTMLTSIRPLEPALRHLPTKDILRAVDRPLNPYDAVLTRGPADPYWDTVPHIDAGDRPRVPALHVNTWHDVGVGETVRLFDHLETLGTPDQHLIIGAGYHCAMSTDDDQADLNFGDLRLGDVRYPGGWTALYMGWFDRWLKEAAAVSLPKVQLYVMNQGWVTGDAWPLPDATPTRFYLHSNGGAGAGPDAGRLTPEPPPGEEAPDVFIYDPDAPTPSRGGLCCGHDVAVDQRDIEVRSDVLVYSTPPLEEGVTVAGPIEVVLYASSSAPDTDLVVKLTDVFPDGTSINLTEDAFRLRYREGFDREVLLEEGEVVRVTLSNGVTGNHFAPGHRIRLQVSSSSFPLFERNLNTGGSNFDETTWATATSQVHHTAAHPSHVVLPILPTP